MWAIFFLVSFDLDFDFVQVGSSCYGLHDRHGLLGLLGPRGYHGYYRLGTQHLQSMGLPAASRPVMVEEEVVF